MAEPRMQCTLAREAEIEGQGLFSSEQVVVRFRPAPPNTGVVFVRSDVDRSLHIPATIDNVELADRRTTVVSGDIQIHTENYSRWNHVIYQTINLYVEPVLNLFLLLPLTLQP